MPIRYIFKSNWNTLLSNFLLCFGLCGNEYYTFILMSQKLIIECLQIILTGYEPVVLQVMNLKQQ